MSYNNRTELVGEIFQMLLIRANKTNCPYMIRAEIVKSIRYLAGYLERNDKDFIKSKFYEKVGI